MLLRLALLFPLLLVACVVSPGTALAPGEICDPSAPGDCASGLCLPLGDGTGICTDHCRTDAGCPAGLTCQAEPDGATALCRPGMRCTADRECPSGHRCDAASGTCFIAVRRGICSACSADPQCPGGACIEAAGTGERFCSVPCAASSECPAGYECRSVSHDGHSSGWCVPGAETCDAARPLCAPCGGDADCGDGNDLCLENFLSGERFCGASCNPDCVRDATGHWNDRKTGGACTSACPDQFYCADLSADGSGPFQCVPNAGTCEGWCDTGVTDELSCGLGRTCEPDEHACEPARDGRPCAPCDDDDACNPARAAVLSRCVANGADETFCAPSCSDDADCMALAGLGFSCVDVADARVCIPDGGSCGGGEGRLGDPCGDGAGSCIGGVCLRFGVEGLCSGRCDADADCGDARWRCCALVGTGEGTSWDCDAAPAEAGSVCVPAGGTFGEACGNGGPPCRDGHCLDLGTSSLCTAACATDADCPASFRCRSARLIDEDGSSSASVDLCFPVGGGGVGADCTFGPAACSDGLCLKKASGNVCTSPCTGGDCPDGWSCGAASTVDGQSVRACLPPSVQG